MLLSWLFSKPYEIMQDSLQWLSSPPHERGEEFLNNESVAERKVLFRSFKYINFVQKPHGYYGAVSVSGGDFLWIDCKVLPSGKIQI